MGHRAPSAGDKNERSSRVSGRENGAGAPFAAILDTSVRYNEELQAFNVAKSVSAECNM